MKRLAAVIMLVVMILSLTACGGREGTYKALAEEMESHRYDSVYESRTNELFKVEKDGKYGYIDTTGQLVIPCEWDSVAHCNG